MAMSLPRPSAFGTRPAYLDNLFRDMPPTSSAHSSTSSISNVSTASNYDLRSAYSTTRSLSPPLEEDRSDTFSLRSKKSFYIPRKLKLGSILHRRTYPQADDLDLSRPSTGRPTPSSAPSSPPPPPPSQPRVDHNNVPGLTPRPSLPKLQTSFPPPQAMSMYAKKPLPAVPGQQQPSKPVQQSPIRKPVKSVQQSPKSEVKADSARPQMERKQSAASNAELTCQRCYYFAARNCQGYVFGGGPGDPCDNCLQSGYFGAI